MKLCDHLIGTSASAFDLPVLSRVIPRYATALRCCVDSALSTRWWDKTVPGEPVAARPGQYTWPVLSMVSSYTLRALIGRLGLTGLQDGRGAPTRWQLNSGKKTVIDSYFMIVFHSLSTEHL